MKELVDKNKMDRNVHITVAGCANVGKSSVMHRIMEVLRNDGFQVERQSELTLLDYGTEQNFEMKMRASRDESLSAIKKRSKIIISEKQFARDFTK